MTDMQQPKRSNSFVLTLLGIAGITCITAIGVVVPISAEDKIKVQQNSAIQKYSDGTVTRDYGTMYVTARDFKWPLQVTSWQECVARSKIISIKYGFTPPLGLPWTGPAANEINASSDHYHLALRWRCSHAGGERMVGVDVTSFPGSPIVITPRDLLDKIEEDFR